MPHVPVELSLTRSRNKQIQFLSKFLHLSIPNFPPTQNPSSLRLLRHSLISQNAPSSLHFPSLFPPMNSSAAATTLSHRKKAQIDGVKMAAKRVANGNGKAYNVYGFDPSFMRWTAQDAVNVVRVHWLPCFFAVNLLFFMAVEYTLRMVPASSPPFDLGFLATDSLHRLLSSWPELNTLLAGLNTVFVGMQTAYILWTWLVEGRPRATISALFMFTCRGILGYSTQLPIPEEFLGSGVDFPVGNVSFFLFFSGHVAGSIIASLDMRRMQRWELAWTFDVLNVLQVVRLLGTRGHYTIDLAAGVGAGILFDLLAGKYEEMKRNEKLSAKEALLS